MKLSHQYPLFVALTRPPMTFGVTQTFFVFNFIPCFCILLLTKSYIITPVVFIVLHIFGVVGCSQDARYFEILIGKLELSCPNRKIWGCNSYDPS